MLPKCGILLAQVVDSLILKVKHIAILAVIIVMFFRSWIHLQSQFCVYNTNSHHVNRHRENLWSDRENTGNFKMYFDWGSCI